MNGRTGRVPCLVVRISRSRASGWAVGEARRRGARLLLVHVFRPPVAAATTGYGLGVFTMPRDPYAERPAFVAQPDYLPGAATPGRSGPRF